MNGGFLLDTNIPSELMPPRPEPKVEAWLAAQDISALFLSVVSIGKLESGFATVVDAARRMLRFNAAERRLMQVLRFLPKNDDPLVRPVAGGRLGRLLQVKGNSARPGCMTDPIVFI